MGLRVAKTFVVALVIAGATGGCTGDQRADSLKVGDCFDTSAQMLAGDDINRVPSVRCAEPHDNEVFHVANYPGGSYSYDDIADFANNVCYSAFSPYVGRSYESSVIDFSWLIPTPDGWSKGDREVICIAFHMDPQRLRGSIRGSGL